MVATLGKPAVENRQNTDSTECQPAEQDPSPADTIGQPACNECEWEQGGRTDGYQQAAVCALKAGHGFKKNATVNLR